MRNDIADADAALQQLALCKWRQQSIGKSGFMQRRPEAIAGTREVVTHRRGVESRINATEKHAQVWRDDVRQSLAGRFDKLLLRRLERFADCHDCLLD